MRHYARQTVLWTICSLSMAWFAVCFAWPAQAYDVLAQNAPTLTPTVTPNPTLVALQAQVDSLIAQIDILESRVDLNKQAMEIQTAKDMFPILISMGVTAIVGAGIGLSSPFLIRKWVREKTEKQLNAAMYKADPTYLPISVPAQGFEIEKKRLKKLGFRALRTYAMLTPAQSRGIVVYLAESKDDMDTLGHFIEDQELNPDQVAFVVYTQERIEGANEIVCTFGSIVFANSPVTIATHIYALARVLVI